MNLAGYRLRYLIGGDNDEGKDDAFTVVGYDANKIPAKGIGGKYVNLFDEKQSRTYGPYLHTSDTAQEYNEGQCDPSGDGFWRNLDDQIHRALDQGFTILGDVDNRDAYSVSTVLKVYDKCAEANLEVIAKNIGMSDMDESTSILLRHPAVIGAIIEKGDVTPKMMHQMRSDAGRSTLPVWFVSFGAGKSWAQRTANQIALSQYNCMGVTYSNVGEYGNSLDILLPVKA